MVYYKLILDKKRVKSDGIYTVVVRIINDKANTTISTGVRIKEEYWDVSAQQVNNQHPNFQQLNQSISAVYLKIQKVIHKLIDANEFSFEALKKELSDKPKSMPVTFKNFSNKIIQGMMDVNRTGNAIVYQTAVNRLLNYCGNDSLKFVEIDYLLLDAFRHKLILDGAKTNTVGNYFRSIRAIYNIAIKSKVVDRSLYPFYDVKIKQQKTTKRAIDIQGISDILGLDIKFNSPRWHARNYFMLSFLLIGASFTDLAYLKPENIVKGRIIFSRRKTHKRYSIKLHEETKKILSYYKAPDSKYLLPIIIGNVQEDSIQAKKLISQWIKTTNKYLKRIGTEIGLESPLTTYVARHTWATTAKRLGYSNELIAEAMGHEYGNRTTAIYLDSFDQDVIDEMNKSIYYKTK